jgi:tRNA (adenine22-N1)-methyltransferase
MPKLDLRLKTVAKQIRSEVHVDIGSDHGHLLAALLKSERIGRGIAIENKRQPFRNSQRTLAGLNAQVRFGDGLTVVEQHEADSLSICGMGAQSIVDILCAHPTRIPNRIVLQPNGRSDNVRRWATESGFRLTDETIARGHWTYDVITFEKSLSFDDPAYRDVDLDAGLSFGPLNLKRNELVFRNQLEAEREYLGRMKRLSLESAQRLALIEKTLSAQSNLELTPEK